MAAKAKVRADIWRKLAGVNRLPYPAGISATASITFNTIPAVDDIVQVGPYYFQFVNHVDRDAPGDSAGTSAASAHQISRGTPSANTTRAADSLAAALKAETATTGQRGFLNPNGNMTAASANVVNIRFWPSESSNDLVISRTNTNGVSVIQANGGADMPILNQNFNVNVINSSTSLATEDNFHYYLLEDGEEIGQEVTCVVEGLGASDREIVIGRFYTNSANQNLCFFNENNEIARWVWTGNNWRIASSGGVVYS